VVPEAVKNLQTISAFTAARDIMTTDRYPKLRSKTLSNGARIVGIAKGSFVFFSTIFFMWHFINYIRYFRCGHD
jgi:N-acetylglutamate synthase/N-acetylornithine aminotransferase